MRHRRLRTVLSGGSKAFCPNTICPLISSNLEFLKFTRTHFLKIASHFLVQDYCPKSICLTSILERMGAITSWKGVEGLHLRERELDLWGVRLPFKRGSIEKKEALPSIVANCLLGKEDTDFHPASPL